MLRSDEVRDGLRPGELRVLASRAQPEVLRLRGELDVATRGALMAVASAAEYRKRDVLVDAAELSFVDCSGLAALVELARAARADGRTFTVAPVSAPLARLTALTGTAAALEA